jgi:hypothetical protein
MPTSRCLWEATHPAVAPRPNQETRSERRDITGVETWDTSAKSSSFRLVDRLSTVPLPAVRLYASVDPLPAVRVGCKILVRRTTAGSKLIR